MRRLLFLRTCVTLYLLTYAGAIANAAVFSVTSFADSGPGTLRQAILDSNGRPSASGPNVIEFAFTGTPPYVIKVQGQFLPPLKGPVVVRMKETAAASAPPTPPPAAQAVADAGGGGRGRGGGGRGAAVPVHAPVFASGPGDLTPTDRDVAIEQLEVAPGAGPREDRPDGQRL